MASRGLTDERARALADALAPVLGYRFSRAELLQEAMLHPSITPEARGVARFGYERLEFLGDRVLGLLISEWLLDRFPEEHEGQLARRLTALVRREALTEVAQNIDLGRHLILSLGEEGAGGRYNTAILADACEALIGALYMDGGIDAVRPFVRNAWADMIESHARPPQDAKTALQEWAQGRGKPLPMYEIVNRTGPDHDPVFEVRVSVSGEPPVTAHGTSKREAEKAAAAALLETLTP